MGLPLAAFSRSSLSVWPTAAASQRTITRRFGHQLDDHLVQFLRQFGHLVARSRGSFIEMAVHENDGGGAIEGSLPGQHLIHEYAERIEVGLVADRGGAANLLGRM